MKEGDNLEYLGIKGDIILKGILNLEYNNWMAFN
jgi:hypothetical protein